MKTRKHGQGMTHKQVVTFSNRLANSAQPNTNVIYSNDYLEAWTKGWEAASKYFAHALREQLRYCESTNVI